MELLPFIWRSLMYFSVVGAVLLAVVVGWHRIMIVARNNNRRRKQRGNTAATTIAFFHPYCSAGGGGERVLWKMVQVLGNLVEKGMLIEQVIIYTVDSPSVSYRQGRFGTKMKMRQSSNPRACSRCAHTDKTSPCLSNRRTETRTRPVLLEALAKTQAGLCALA